jgi:hypothetical protein
MSTYRFSRRGKTGVVDGLEGEVASRLIEVKPDPVPSMRGDHLLHDTEPLTEEQIRNLPVAHRYSS